MESEIYIVAWADFDDGGANVDSYEIFSKHDYDNPLEAAQSQYASVVAAGAYCASISKMVEGTDWVC